LRLWHVCLIAAPACSRDIGVGLSIQANSSYPSCLFLLSGERPSIDSSTNALGFASLYPQYRIEPAFQLRMSGLSVLTLFFTSISSFFTEFLHRELSFAPMFCKNQQGLVGYLDGPVRLELKLVSNDQLCSRDLKCSPEVLFDHWLNFIVSILKHWLLSITPIRWNIPARP